MTLRCKDIPDRRVLEFVRIHGGVGCNWFESPFPGSDNPRSVRNAMPEAVREIPNLVHAKMRRLITRGLVSGCPCGCRGDFEITDKGRELLAEVE